MLRVVCGVPKIVWIFVGIFVVFLVAVSWRHPATAETINTSVDVRPSTSITISPNTLNTNLNPSSNDFSYADLDVTVGTNNETGYKLTMSTDSTDLVNVTDSSKVIPTLATKTGGYTDTEFSDCVTSDCVNRWGYKRNRFTDNYDAFPDSTLLLQNNTRTNGDTANLRFATKIDYTKPSGLYKTTIVFSLVTNPLCKTTISGTMQNFDPCPDMEVGTSGTLTDARDGKSYTVAKLADEQIWMISYLNLAGGTKLYSETSDVPGGYPASGGVGYYELPDSVTTLSGAFSSSTVGEYVYNSGNETTSQSDCTSTQPCNSYYSWPVATAGSKDVSGNLVTSDGVDAAYSICPKGWGLPTAGSQTDNSYPTSFGYKRGDVYRLAIAYGASLESSYIQNSSTFYNRAGPGTLPNFLLNGYCSSGSFSSAAGGTWGYTWASTARSETTAYALSLTASSVRAPGDSHRSVGISVRCMFKSQN